MADEPSGTAPEDSGEAGKGFSRRRLLAYGAGGAGLVAVGGTIGTIAGRSVRGGAREDDHTNPFAYPVDPLAPVDPEWVHFEQIAGHTVPFEQVKRITIGPDGRVYIGGDQRIGIFDADLAPVGGFDLAAPPTCLAVADDGDVLVGLKDHLEVYQPDGRRRAAWERPDPRAWLTGVAARDEHVFVADAGARRVWHHDRTGRLLGPIGAPDRDRNIPGFVVPSPFFDLDIGRDGLLRVANPGRHRVETYTFDGDLELAWGRPSLGIEGFSGCCNPINMALMPDGRCVTCEKGIPRVKVYDPDGTLASVVAGPDAFKLNAMACSGTSDCRNGGLDVAVDGQQRVLVLDLVALDVRVFTRKQRSDEGQQRRSDGATERRRGDAGDA